MSTMEEDNIKLCQALERGNQERIEFIESLVEDNNEEDN